MSKDSVPYPLPEGYHNPPAGYVVVPIKKNTVLRDRDPVFLRIVKRWSHTPNRIGFKIVPKTIIARPYGEAEKS